MRLWMLCLITAGIAGLLPADSGTPEVVFRSDVALVRVDAQVVDRDNRTIAGLHVEDFLLLENGHKQEIRNFARENMPVDIVLLFDVSRSMRPHVERVASAADQAMQVLGSNDRVAIMVFDTTSRVRMPFRSRDEMRRGIDSLLDQEDFQGGTDINRGIIDAAAYIGREGRRDARRAIVILTDDQTQHTKDVEAANRALTNADAALSALIAPDAMRGGGGGRRGGYGGGRGGSGGGLGGPLGGIILGRGGPMGRGGGRGGPGGGMGARTHSAGTEEIARNSGGDSMPLNESSAFQDTLSRLRQRYALHFYLPQGVKGGEERQIEVQLTEAARRRYPDAEVRFRRNYMAPGATDVVYADSGVKQRQDTTAAKAGWKHVDGDSDHSGPLTGGSSASDEQAPASSSGGWRKLKPGEQP